MENKTGVLINSWLDAEGMENVGFKLLVDHVEKWMFIKSKGEEKKKSENDVAWLAR